jgi:hypothetical protein
MVAVAAEQRCTKCAHYFITYDVRFPYGCRLMGFKSRQLPQQEILRLTGIACQTFEARRVKKSS